MTALTSKQAYRENLANGYIKAVAKKVYMAVQRFPNKTAREIHQLRFSEKQLDSVRPRFAQLKRAGLIYKSGVRRDKSTGKRASTWATETHVASPLDIAKMNDYGRKFIGVKMPGEVGTLYTSEAVALDVHSKTPGSELIWLREVQRSKKTTE